MSTVEINFESIDKCGIIIDGEPVNGVNEVQIEMKAGYMPKVHLIPAVTVLQFGDRAAVDVYVDGLEQKTLEMLHQVIRDKLGYVDSERESK